MKIPNEIKILGHTYKIIWDKTRLLDNEWAKNFPDKGEIVMSEDIPKEWRFSCFLHEILHTIDYHCGLELSHQTITTLDAALSQVFMQTMQLNLKDDNV